MNILNDVIDGVNTLIDTNLQSKPFAEITEGTIIQKNSDDTYIVEINGKNYNMELYIKRELNKYDIVKIVKPDRSLNNAFIL